MIPSWLTERLPDLLTALKAGAHALLFTGPKGIGKRLLAEQLASLRLCLAPAGTTVCGRCDSCHWIAAGTHPDLMVLESAAEASESTNEEEGGAESDPTPAKGKKPSRQILIEQVRNLLNRIELTAHAGPGRVILIDHADQLNSNAANALLKTLEEPPARTIFILITAAEERLPVTVRSRCRRVPISAPPQAAGLSWLTQQGVTNADVLLRLAGGAPLRASAMNETDLLDRWNKLNQDLSSEGIRRLNWDTTPEALTELCLLLQLLTIDVQRRQTGAARRYGAGREVDALARQASPEQVSDFWRVLRDIRGTLHHPLNPTLVRDRLLISFDRLLQGTPVAG